ncbi:hypothetical protein BD626DRAFT_451522 [Schizophyllum amplum]|uniref:BTB domain-containing protein n=1 Tax=Schizophyllum amplum TaxID=97359 RepID=A0A550CNY8_9AGAR|nr:hypothetical protein BD626DRAFT_451522 [Auriculariopsis ampla]
MSLPDNCVEDLWFPDGNIVIRAGDRLCRVYKGFLAAQSPVLADMLSIPQPETVETFDEVPVVTLPDDPKEVLHWLKALLFPKYFEVHPHKIAVHKLFAVLRLSHKYDVQYLRQRALYHLSTEFATNLAEYRRGTAEWCSSIRFPPGGDRIDSDGYIDFVRDAYTVVREAGAVWLLPCILYCLHVTARLISAPLDRTAEGISPTDLLSLWQISGTTARIFGVSITEKWAECTSNACEAIDKYMIDDLYTNLLFHPLGFSRPDTDGDDDVHFDADTLKCSLCTPCYQEFYQEYLQLCGTFWEELPRIIGLPDWPELLEMKARDLGMSADSAK